MGRGTKSTTTTDANGNKIASWSISAFINESGGVTDMLRNWNCNYSDIAHIWHAHPSDSKPSPLDKQMYKKWSQNFFPYRNHAIILGARDGKINFYNKGTIKKFDYEKIRLISMYAKMESLILSTIKK